MIWLGSVGASARREFTERPGPGGPGGPDRTVVDYLQADRRRAGGRRMNESRLDSNRADDGMNLRDLRVFLEVRRISVNRRPLARCRLGRRSRWGGNHM